MLKRKIQTKLAKAFDDKLADAVKHLVLKKVKAEPTLDELRLGQASTDYPTRGIFDYGGQGITTETGGTQYVRAPSALILESELVAVPEVDDMLQDHSGKLWRITHASIDPVQAAWDITLEDHHKKP